MNSGYGIVEDVRILLFNKTMLKVIGSLTLIQKKAMPRVGNPTIAYHIEPLGGVVVNADLV